MPKHHHPIPSGYTTAADQPAPPTNAPFRPYLSHLYQFVVNFLDGAVIRQIDLGITDRPDQVPHSQAPRATARLHNPLQLRVMPWMQRHTPAPPQIEAFDTFGEAFAANQERVVLLGEPGAGKTITLLNQLRESITARLADPTQPLPLFAFITSWDAQKRQAFPVWLQQQQPTLSHADIESLLASGQAVLFLDGLDELGAEQEEEVKNEGGKEETRVYDPRERFIEAFTAAIGNNRALVSCRVRDYADIGAQIPLNGAVELNPLSDEQIRQYLAELPELLAAIEADDNLKQMLRTPLLMSLFAFAFRDELTADQRQTLRDMAHTDAEDLRDKLIMLYLERRYQWEASKSLPMPFSYEDWLTMLQRVAYRGVDTFVNYYGDRDIFRRVTELNVLQRNNIALDLPDTAVGDFLVFSQSLNIILPIEADTYRFQHLLLLGALASPMALDHLQQRQMAVTACRVLGELQVKRAIKPLIRALGGADKYVRRIAAEVLGKSGDTRTVEPFIRALNDPDWGVRRIAAEVLGQIGDAQAVEPLILALGDADSDVRRYAAEALISIGKPAVKSLIHTLGDRDRDVGRRAAQTLVSIGEPAVPTLIRALGDTYVAVRWHAAQALGEIGWRPNTVEETIANAFARHDWEALEGIGEPALSTLIRAFGDTYVAVRWHAAQALGEIGWRPITVEETIANAFARHDWEGLEGIGEPAVSTLIHALGDTYVAVRWHASEALRQIGWQPTTTEETIAVAFARQEWKTLVTIRGPAVSTLIGALGDADSEVRSYAAAALGKIGDARAVKPLKDLLHDQERLFGSEQRVCDVAAMALKQIGTPDALAVLEAWLAAGNSITRG